MDSGLDTILLESGDDSRPVNGLTQKDRKDVIARLTEVVPGERNTYTRNVVQKLAISLHKFSPATICLRQLLQLNEPDGRPDLIHPVVQSGLNNVIGDASALVPVQRQAGHAMGTQVPALLVQSLRTSYEHPTFADREILVRKETKTTDITNRPATLTLVVGTGSVGGVLNKGDVPCPSGRPEKSLNL
jgi:hypothetical protein